MLYKNYTVKGKIIYLFLALSMLIAAGSTQIYAAVNPVLVPTVNYPLPYPGILPGNPLYFLKVIRDKLVDFLISDPLKKATFDLTLADKRLNAGIYLFNEGSNEYNLAESTISKDENYFVMALNEAKAAKQQGEDISSISNQLLMSSEKHQEVISGLIGEISGVNSSLTIRLKADLGRAEQFQQDAKNLIAK